MKWPARRQTDTLVRAWRTGMGGSIYLIQGAGTLVEMKERVYDSEDLLQTLIAQYPDVLAGGGHGDSPARRWLLVSREVALASEDGGSGRWSVDHLFVDQDAIPTLVEVKRSRDTRIRREVVGQMMDYAANGVVYWPLEQLQSVFASSCARRGADPDQALGEFLGAEEGREAFWERVRTNLKAGRVRLVFVADEIPPELRRIIEFLNEQMDPAEVLGVEIRQYVGPDLRTLVPRVVGQTATAEARKAGETRQWDDSTFFAELADRQDQVGARVARSILEWAEGRGLRLEWGRGIKDGGCTLWADASGQAYPLIAVRTGFKSPYVQVQFGALSARPPFDDESKRQEFRRRLNEIRGVAIPSDGATKYPSIRLTSLQTPDASQGLFASLEWALREIGAPNVAG
jgi:hypothetical protein